MADHDVTDTNRLLPEVRSSVIHTSASAITGQLSEDNLIPGEDIQESVDSKIVSAQDKFTVYSSRWYVLAVFCAISFLQSGFCTVWPVIAETVEVTFGWTDSQVSLMQSWFYVTYIFAMFPFAWLMDTKGLRVSMIVCAFLVVTATALRCISMQPPHVTWINNIANCLNGIAGPVPFTAGPVISSMWFPAHQRSTATAIAMSAGFVAPAMTFIIGPSFIDSPEKNASFPSDGENIHYTNMDEMRHQIRMVRLCECLVTVVVTIAICVYFPSRPPTPPSRSASMPKFNILQGLKQLFKRQHGNFWLLCLAASISSGVYSMWIGLLDVALKPTISEVEAGWLGFFGVLAGCVAAVIIGRLADVLSGVMKVLAVLLLCVSVFAAYWFVLISGNYVPFSTYQLYASVILIGLCNNGSIPLLFEMAAEKNYPISEIVTASVITLMFNIWPICFLLVFLIPSVGVSWVSWCLFGSLVACVPLLLGFKEKYNRLEVDDMVTVVD